MGIPPKDISRIPGLAQAMREQHRAEPPASQPGKYRNKITVVDGIKFHSTKEATRYSELKLLQAAGEVTRFHRQVIFDLAGVTYRCDFMVIYPDGRIDYEDSKGARTAMFIAKKKQVREIYGVEIIEN